jgi:IclR family acetate operon transcriptional repressor
MPSGTQAIDRAAQLLVMIVESDDATSVGELSHASGLPKSTVSRLVSALERQGLVQRQDDRGPLRPGPVLLRMARRGVGPDDVVTVCDSAMRRLSEASGETIDLAVPMPGGVEHYVAQIDGRYILGTTNWVGRSLPHHSTAVGKVLVAFSAAHPPRRPLHRFTAATITDPGRFEAQLEGVRARGYAVTEGELETGLVAVAAPLLGPDGRAVAALSISGPAFRIPAERFPELGGLLINETHPLSAQLGYASEGAA